MTGEVTKLTLLGCLFCAIGRGDANPLASETMNNLQEGGLSIHRSGGTKNDGIGSFLDEGTPLFTDVNNPFEKHYLPNRGILPEPKTREIDWHSKLQKIIDIRCLKNKLSILLHLESSYSLSYVQDVDILKSGHYSLIGSISGVPAAGVATPDKCRGIVNTEPMVTLESGFGECGTTKTKEQTTIIYNNKVFVDLGTKGRYTLNVSCAYPLEDLKEVPAMGLTMHTTKKNTSAWKFPKKMVIGQTVFAEANAKLSWFHRQELQGIPVTCWLSNSDETTDRPDKPFVKNGCPVEFAVSSTHTRGLSMVRFAKSRPVRVSFLVNPLLLPSDRRAAFLHCYILPCVRSHRLGIAGLPTCPPSHHCDIKSRDIAWDFDDAIAHHVTAGPLQVMTVPKLMADYAAKEHQQLQPLESREGCTPSCFKHTPDAIVHSTLTKGVSTNSVIFIALTCFCAGILLTTVLWSAHYRQTLSRSKGTPPKGRRGSLRDTKGPADQSELPNNTTFMLQQNI